MAYETKTLLGGAQVTADFESFVTCKRCKTQIIWAVTKRTKKMPVEKDAKGNWIAHFANCRVYSNIVDPYAPDSDLFDHMQKQKEREKW